MAQFIFSSRAKGVPAGFPDGAAASSPLVVCTGTGGASSTFRRAATGFSTWSVGCAGWCLFVCLFGRWREREREREDCGVSRELLGRARAIERVATLTVAPSSISDILRSRQAHRESERGGGVVRVCLVRARLIFLSHFLGDPIRPRSTPQKKQARNARREFFPTRGFATTGLDGEKAFLEVHMHMGPLKRRNGEARD